MISKLFERHKLSKSERKKFIPFVNQRDFMGSLISNKRKSPSGRNPKSTMPNSIAIIQNLKKTTKQYFFDKKYNKMVQKLHRMEDSMRPKQHNYDEQIDQCLKTVSSNAAFLSINKEQEKYYIDLSEQLSQKINLIKKNLLHRITQSKTSKKKHHKIQVTNLQDQYQSKEMILNRQATLNKQNYDLHQDHPKKISKQIFQQIGTKSQYMTDFTNAGLKYKQFVEPRRLNPWKKWYSKDQIELFPGQKITIKRLKKTIY